MCGGGPLSGLLELRKHTGLCPLLQVLGIIPTLLEARGSLGIDNTHGSLSCVLAPGGAHCFLLFKALPLDVPLPTGPLARHTLALQTSGGREEFPFSCLQLPADSFTISCQGQASEPNRWVAVVKSMRVLRTS